MKERKQHQAKCDSKNLGMIKEYNLHGIRAIDESLRVETDRTIAIIAQEVEKIEELIRVLKCLA